MDSDDEDYWTARTEDHNLEGKREGDARDKHGHAEQESSTLWVRLTADGLRNKELRRKCVSGTGQIYRFIPLYPTTSNGYIGRNETSLLRRIQGHKTPKSECKGLSNAIKKHGLDQFAIVVLEGSIPVSQLANAEAKYVAQYDTYHNGYNCTPGSEAPPLLVPEIAAKVKATKNTAVSKAKTVAASRRHWDNLESHARHAAALRESMKKSKAARDAYWKPFFIEKRKAAMATMDETQKAKYLRKNEMNARSAEKQRQELKLLRLIPGYENSVRENVAKAKREGVLVIRDL